MQNEREHLQHLVFTINSRIAQIPEGERPASNKLLRSYEIKNQTILYIKRALVEIMGRDDAYAIVEEAEKEATEWHAGLKR